MLRGSGFKVCVGCGGGGLVSHVGGVSHVMSHVAYGGMWPHSHPWVVCNPYIGIQRMCFGHPTALQAPTRAHAHSLASWASRGLGMEGALPMLGVGGLTNVDGFLMACILGVGANYGDKGEGGKGLGKVCEGWQCWGG
jgi:hypothetical protein